jgi:hypothetical protein
MAWTKEVCGRGYETNPKFLEVRYVYLNKSRVKYIKKLEIENCRTSVYVEKEFGVSLWTLNRFSVIKA